MDESTIRIKCQRCGAQTVATVKPGTSHSLVCSGCRTHLVEFEVLRGFVYILSHPQMPNLVKIGFTTRPVEARVAELSTATSAPGPFVIEAVFPTAEPENHEFAAHERLASARLPSKEFFRVDLADAIASVSALCGPPSYLRTQAPMMPPPPLPKRRIARESGPSTEETDNRLREWQERMFKK
jgi:hypothetical protein